MRGGSEGRSDLPKSHSLKSTELWFESRSGWFQVQKFGVMPNRVGPSVDGGVFQCLEPCPEEAASGATSRRTVAYSFFSFAVPIA